MPHPLEFLPPTVRKPFFYFFLALTLIVFGIFSQLDKPLKLDESLRKIMPCGVVSFEVAGDVDSAQRMVNSLKANEQALLSITFGLGFDYLFMPVYALALSLGLLLARGEHLSRYYSLANFMGWGAFAATLFDATENYALWHTLTLNAVSPYPQLAAVCATIKFGLLIVGLVTAVAATVYKRFHK